MGPSINWVHSYVTDEKIYCMYIAPNEEMVREHAKLGGFPANKVSQVFDDHRSDDVGAQRIGAMSGAARNLRGIEHAHRLQRRSAGDPLALVGLRFRRSKSS